MANKLYAFFHLFFRLLLIYFLVFVWVRYYSQSVHFAIWITALVTFFIELIIRLFTQKKKKNLTLKQADIEKMDALINTLIFNQTTFANNFVFDMVKTKYNATKKKNYIVIEQPEKPKIVLACHFTIKPFLADDLVNIWATTKSENASKIVVCTNKADKDAFKLASLVIHKTIILEKQDFYTKLVKPLDYSLPPDKLVVVKNNTSSNIKSTLKQVLSRKRSKGYFISSILLLFSCLIVPYNLYYLIFSSILLLLAISSFVAPLFIKRVPDKILE